MTCPRCLTVRRQGLTGVHDYRSAPASTQPALSAAVLRDLTKRLASSACPCSTSEDGARWRSSAWSASMGRSSLLFVSVYAQALFFFFSVLFCRHVGNRNMVVTARAIKSSWANSATDFLKWPLNLQQAPVTHNITNETSSVTYKQLDGASKPGKR